MDLELSTWVNFKTTTDEHCCQCMALQIAKIHLWMKERLDDFCFCCRNCAHHRQWIAETLKDDTAPPFILLLVTTESQWWSTYSRMELMSMPRTKGIDNSPILSTDQSSVSFCCWKFVQCAIPPYFQLFFTFRGLVPLHNACSYGHYEVAELLVKVRPNKPL